MRHELAWCAAGCLLVAALAAPAPAQQRAGPVQSLLAAHGGVDQFPRGYRRALGAFINAENSYFRGDPAAALATMNRLWADLPPGSARWRELESEAHAAVEASGLNIGSPPCYYALRMLGDCCTWKLSGETPAETAPIVWTIVLVGHLEGKQPHNEAQRAAQGGRVVRLELDPQILDRDYAVIRQATRLFREYVAAITRGRLDVKLNFVRLDDLTVPGVVKASPNSVAGIDGPGFRQIWNAVPEATKRETDWWWILYPSNVPEQYPAFRTTEFITGGMGRGPDGQSPCFIIDDRWLVRKPPHLGRGPMDPLERRAYLPQWLQHEFFHHLFAIYPEYRLETERGHDWFDRSTWPRDFEGQFEPDYYYEALHKRLAAAPRPLHETLKYAPRDLSAIVTPEMLAGRYRRAPVENDWHVGELTLEAEGPPRQYRWTNQAGVSWRLTDALDRGVLFAAEDSPYADEPGGREFAIQLRPAEGDATPRVEGFRFRGEFYRRGGRRR